MKNDSKAQNPALSQSNSAITRQTQSPVCKPPSVENEGNNFFGFLLIAAGTVSVISSFFIESDVHYLIRIAGFGLTLFGIKLLKDNLSAEQDD